MDDLLKPSDQMLFTLATELGLMSLVTTNGVEGASTEESSAQPVQKIAQKVATLT